MPIQSSYQSVAEQILTLNANMVDLLSKLNALTTTSDPSVTINITDGSGIASQVTVPSFGYLQSEINRLNNNINSIYNINESGALIQSTTANKYKKIVTVDLNRAPNDLDSLGAVTEFKSQKNWFFDGLLNPALYVSLDLSGKIEDNVRKILVRRYIIDFSKDSDGNFTDLGQSALNSFNALFRNQSNTTLDTLTTWISTTPGVLNATDPNYDEQVFDLEPNKLQYDGIYTVVKLEEDTVNRKLWYHVDTLRYVDTTTNEAKQLAIGDELMVNVPLSTTRYRILEISTSASNPRLRFDRVEGIEPIPVGIVGALKLYSPVLYTKTVMISIGYDERNVIFIKPLDANNHLLSKNWSLGTGYWSNDLRLNSNDGNDGFTMEQFYIDKVYDYGTVLQDLVAQKIPTTLSGIPPAPTLNVDNFKVVQINQHLTNTSDANLLKSKHNQQKALQSEIQQLNEAIINKNKQLNVTRFTSDAEKNQFINEIDRLTKTKDSKSKLLSSVVSDILSLSNSPVTKTDPKFRVRGFWVIPSAVVTRNSRPQEIVQFRVQYRYLSKDGSESPILTLKLNNVNATSNTQAQKTAAFSNWTEFKTDARKRTYDPATSQYTWQIEDVTDADTPNINQIDLSIQYNERVEVRIKSISEAGWPDSPVESDWSDIISIEFPDNLNNVLNENDFILTEATKEDLKVNVQNELTARGLDDHLSQTTVINNKTYNHTSDRILSGFKDSNGVALDLYQYLQAMENRIKSLEEKIKRAKGELEVIIYRNSDKFVVKNNSEISFNVECEDYLDAFTGTGIPTGRVYANNIYVIRDFLMKVRNASTDSPLGLVSNKSFGDSDVYNTSVPQVFWVDEENELISSNDTGSTRTQLSNQFLWMVNYSSLEQTTVTKLSDNIGNSFVSLGNNSITNVLSSTDFNIGYSETSVLSFVGSNNSLLDSSKWIDTTTSVSSTTKLLTSVHPVISDLGNLVEANSEKVKVVNPGESNDVNIPINIYFKMNSLDTTKTGLDYQYINLNNATKTIKHVKKLRLLLENEAESTPFIFTVKFIINRNKVVVKKNIPVSAAPNVANSLQSANITNIRSAQ